jgi:signal transduction histidine kinase
MRRPRFDALRLLRAAALIALIAWTAGGAGVGAATVEPRQADMLTAPDATPPGPGRDWRTVPLPDVWRHARPEVEPEDTWYRLRFDYPQPAATDEAWALYLPYLYDGGKVWLNGTPVTRVEESSHDFRVRWAGPHLLTLTPSALRPGTNELAVRTALPREGAAVGFPRPVVGPLAELLPLYERREFWVTIMPEITFAVCLLGSAFVLFIWWRRPSEVLFGWFGLAVVLWGIRTLTFVVEKVPSQLWLMWRFAFLGATGGFVLAMAVLALRFAGFRKPWLERGLVLYWAAGPVWLVVGGVPAERLVNRYWLAGFALVGVGIIVTSVIAIWRQRTLHSAVLPLALIAAALAGLHDYLVNWSLGGAAQWLLADWAGNRIFLLHHGANLVLLAMAGLLTSRFLQALESLEALNQTLETRIGQRERELSDNYEHTAALQREHAAAQERQRIMREIHDGLGSRLFVSLSRVERGDMQAGEIADTLRACIADMRLALDTLAPDDNDFRATLGNFLFRWQAQLQPAGIQPSWTIDVADGAVGVTAHASLQLLRIAQEALTNVLKHARASRVQVRVSQADGILRLEVEDDGSGRAAARAGGRGLRNMKERARQLGGTLDVLASPGGTCVALRVPVNAVLAEPSCAQRPPIA